MYRMACFSILVLLVFSLGCNSGGGLIVWDIEGPTSIEAGAEAYFHIWVGQATGITYQWAVDPTDAGDLIPLPPLVYDGTQPITWFQFGSPNMGRVVFVASSTPTDVPVTLRVAVSSNEYAPVLSELVVKIVGYQNF